MWSRRRSICAHTALTTGPEKKKKMSVISAVYPIKDLADPRLHYWGMFREQFSAGKFREEAEVREHVAGMLARHADALAQLKADYGCEHGRLRSQCKECGGSSICEHGRIRSECKECGGSQICEHGRCTL